MRRRLIIFIVACLLCLAGAWFFWPRPASLRTKPSALQQAAALPVAPAAAATNVLTAAATNTATSAKSKPFAFRLSNTTQTLGQLMGDRHAILLENALIDSSRPLNFSIPSNLQSPGDPGAYIVQARGPIGNAFRAMLAQAGAEIVSYIPNNAYLVRATAGVANGLAGNPLAQAVVPYEPYYKISSSMSVTAGQRTLSSTLTKTNPAAGPTLLDLAVGQKPLPAGTFLTLGLFRAGAAATEAQIEKLGGQVVGRDKSPFGPVVRVRPPANWVALAALPGVQIVEPLRQRVHANDLSRATVGVAADTQVSSNYMGLTGQNVLVEVNDSGIDASHPDLTGRVFGDPTLPSLVDTNGHGTHVAGTIAGSGLESPTVTNASGSIMPATNYQFRGMAPLANLYSVAAIDNTFSYLNVSDQYLQEAPALTNALISNNSWNYDGDNAYDLSAASYDAAVRDALPEVTGSQPVLFVFSAGNAGGADMFGNGENDGGGGNADTILSPATAKNVITVGALEQLRNITNQVTDLNSNQSAVWQPMTDSSSQVAGYSSRGNVGIGTEGDYGRFKPDVVAPGSFVVSTRSSQWDEQAYYSPTNYYFDEFSDTVGANSSNAYFISLAFIPPNTVFNSNIVAVSIQVVPNIYSPVPFPDFSIYVSKTGTPVPTNPSTYDFVTMNNQVSIPPDGGNSYLTGIQEGYLFYLIVNTNNESVDYDVITEIVATNQHGNYFEVLSNLNDSIGTLDSEGKYPYRYESGTSMAAADASGVLALMQDYFTNTLQATPSPALLKALLINGARLEGGYTYDVQSTLNDQGWGVIYLPDSLPPGITTNVNNANGEAMLILDQSPTTALATGDSHTYSISIPPGSDQQYLPLRVTLAWTDPPGDPAAAIKLVNSLELVVTNFSDPANPVIYYGNDIASGKTYNTPETTNTANYDSINNVQNVFIPAVLGTQYSITVIGRSVNVNAVTAQTNNALGAYAPNVVQDYALVISCGEGEVTNAFTVTDNGIVSNPTSDQQITYVVSPDAPYMNQLAGASTPLLGTNTVPIGTNWVLNPTNNLPMAIVPGFATNAIVTLGMTNQWHFYVMTNPGPADFTNAAFITFDPETLSIPRMGVFADSTADATRPEADIDLYVSRDPTLLNLNPAAISNCVHGTQVGLSAAGVFNGASLGRGGTEFVADIGSAPGDVYYVGVYSEDQEAAQYGFIPIFTDVPFSQMNSNGTQVVNGLLLPQYIPDGSPAHPGVRYVFALAIFPEEIQRVVVTNVIAHQHLGDLIGGLKHGGMNGLSQTVYLNNHDAPFNPPSTELITNTFIYDDSGQNNITGAQPSDGPGSLNSYVGQAAIGPWILTEVDDSLTQTGSVTGFSLEIDPHQNLGKGVYGTVGPMGWWYGYIEVPSGTAGLTILATNITQPPSLTPPLELYVNSNGIPTLTDTNEYGPAGLTNSGPYGPWNSIAINAPGPGIYWVGLYNGSVQQQNFYLIANLGLVTPPAQVIYTSSGPVPILDDAVTTDSMYVTADQGISSVDVALRVDHPRVSDLVFHLISPSGTRVLLVENRGGNTANMGGTIAVTNIVPVSSSGGAGAVTNVINLAASTGTVSIFYNFYEIPDTMVVLDQSGAQIFDSGLINGSGVFNIGYTNSSTLTIIMNPGGGILGTGWDYTVRAMQGRQTYLVLTEDTNKTTTPIKFAPPPFVPVIPAMTANPPEWHNSFEGVANGQIPGGNYFAGGWYVDPSGSIDVYAPPSVASWEEGTGFVDMDGSTPGIISTNIATVPGQNYTLAFTYAQNANGKLFGHPTALLQALQNGNPLLTLTVTQTNDWTNLGWTTTSVVFTATSNITTLTFQSLDPSGDAYGVLLDCIDLTPSTLNDGFENTYAGDYVAGVNPGFAGWTVNANQVTVIADTNLAQSGSNLLALADGQISRILPTTPGQTYTLSFAYRGPGAVSLWRGESNTVDFVSGNNGIPSPGIAYTAPGEVGSGFSLNNSNAYFWAAANPSLDVGTGGGLTLEGWINVSNVNVLCPIAEWNQDQTTAVGVQFWINDQPVTQGGSDQGVLVATFLDTSGLNFIHVKSPNNTLVANTTQHVAVTYNQNTGWIYLYVNGAQVQSYFWGNDAPQTSYDFWVAHRPQLCSGCSTENTFLGGLLDEFSLYNRGLSASEIMAIYQQGTNHLAKYNTNAPSISMGLAEAQVTLNSTNQPIFFGDNTSWQTITYSFVATTTNTPLQVAGLEPGMLLDSFVLTPVDTNNYDLFYLPEESLDLLQGENALGQWTLEIQDDRAGAGLTNTLVSWQLRFDFPFTPPTITTLTNTQVITSNTVPPGGIVYFLVQVPTNADISTNILFNTTGPLNLLFDAFNPPTGLLPTDYFILSTPAPGGQAILTTTSVPTNFAAGGIYYLGVQNPNSVAVTFNIQVNFHLVPPPLALPQLPELIAYTNQLFVVTNAATGGVPPLTYAPLTSTVPGPNVPVIDANGAITWTPDPTQAPAVYTLTNIVYDSSASVQWATDIFHVLVVLTNGQPAFPGAEGAGGFAIGGRGGDVYHVVNLNDSGPGSLRYGIESTFGSRTIVFDVSGTINLYSPLSINNPYFTIAGQTAPGAGITIQGLMFSAETASGALDSAHDEVLRFVRCRPGDIYAQYFKSDSFHFGGVTNSIADHLSASWSLNTVLSATNSTNVTVQWSVIAQSLDHSAYSTNNNTTFQEHGDGSLIRYGSGAVSYLHNLYADNNSQNPRVGDNIQLDFINNVVCNWGADAGLNGDDSADNPGGYANYLNYRGNYFIAGSNSANSSIAFASYALNATNTQIYEATNLIDTNAFAFVLDGTNTDWGMFGGLLTQLTSPTLITNGISSGTNDPAFAYEQVLDFAGASVAGATTAGSPAAGTSLLRDPVDTNIVANVRNKSGQIIDFISSNSFSGGYFSTNFGVTYGSYSNAALYWVAQGLTNFVGVNPWPVLASAPQPLDSDGDGIPDYWDITLQAVTGDLINNPSVPHNNHSNPDGYTDLEHYLNWLAAPHALTVSNTPVDVDLYAIAGRTGNLNFGVTNGTNGTVTLGGDGHTATFMPSNNYFGFASFGFTVTNLDTSFGGTNLENGFDVTVSVMVSITNIVTSSLPVTNAVPETNTVPAGGIVYFLVNVPFDAQLATNILFNVSGGPLNLLFSRAGFPTGTNTGDYPLMTNSLGGTALLGVATNFIPTNIIAGGTYYLGVQNPGGTPVSFALQVDFYPPPSVPPGGVFYYAVTVPTNAVFATNILLYATLPLNIWFTTNSPPSITNAGDVQLLPNAAYPGGTNGLAVLSASTTPPLVPGSTYYLGVQNTNSAAVYFALEVDFLLAPAVPGPISISSITATSIGGTNGFLLTWFAPTNDLFQVQWTGNLAPTVAWTAFSNIIAYTSLTPTNGIGFFEFFDDGSQFPFGPVRYYRLVLLQSLTNGLPEVGAVSPGGIDYFLVNVPTNADFATNQLFFANWPVNLLFNQTAPPTGTNAGDYFLLTNSMSGLSIMSTTSAPTNIVPGGTYWLGVQNTNSVAVTFSLGVNFHLISTNLPPAPMAFSSIIYTNINAANGFLLTWFAPSNELFGVRWTPSLAPVSWTTIPDLISYNPNFPASLASAQFNFFDDGSLTGGLDSARYYQLIYLGVAPLPASAASISSVTLTTNGLFQLQWSAPASYYQFQVEWTTNLAPPITWFTNAGSITSGTTNFTFVDTNAAVTMKFYRLVQQFP